LRDMQRGSQCRARHPREPAHDRSRVEDLLLGLGILFTRVLAAIVYQATPRDPVVLGGVIVAMLVLGLFATWIPARRALSLNPLALLREE